MKEKEMRDTFSSNNFGEDLKTLTDKILALSDGLPFGFDFLENLLDAATMFAVCKEEYSDYAQILQKYNFLYDYLEKILSILEEYGITTILPPILKETK